MMGAVCAAVVLAGLCAMGQQQRWNEIDILFREAELCLRAEHTPETFANYYERLYTKDPARARHFAVLYFWLVEDPVLCADIFSDACRTGGGTLRNNLAITTLTITSFTVGTTSVFIRVEWPAEVILPYYWICLKGKQSLDEEEWQLLGFMDVTPGPGPGWAE